nr:hypothetical protein [Candidatus Sigynarchaeota archaeon]
MATENARFFHFISNEIRQEHLLFKHVTPASVMEKPIQPDTVIITTTTESRVFNGEILAITYDDERFPINYQNVLEFFRLLKIMIETGRKALRSVMIGLDPGFKHTGVAIFINGIIIEAITLPTNEIDIEKHIFMILNHAHKNQATDEPCHVTIKIGNGNPVEMQKIVNVLQYSEMPMAFELQVVDEKRSNTDFIIQDSSFIKISGIHARAAINIALRDGTPASIDKHPDGHQLVCHDDGKLVGAGLEARLRDGKRRDMFSKKYLHTIQDESRKITIHDDTIAGGISIDETLATKVLLGKLTLQEAINQQKERMKKNGSISTNRETI